ncbi:hypothetical protein HZC32_03310 [Candidatus Woesearchaeota archaeon]|nr:hypothetical protein [Candidatus Woesearchaeota archaeon]
MVNKIVAPESGGFDPARLYVWVKSLESKVNNLLRETDLLKNNFIKKNEELKKELKVTTDELLELKRGQQKMEEKMDLIIKELKQTAGMEEVMTLKKYVELWSPLNFVTQRDLDRALDSKIAVLREVLSKDDHHPPRFSEHIKSGSKEHAKK